MTAPLFKLFWENSRLNATRGRIMAERIGADSVQVHRPPRPRFPQAAISLAIPNDLSADIWTQRRSGREFADRAIDLQQLSSLCWPFAERRLSTQSPQPLTRHCASGGGKYPLLVYAALLNVADEKLQGRLTWYDPNAHGLTPISNNTDWPTLAHALSVDWQTSPAVVFFITARCAGTLAKYGERGGRFMLLEAGSYLGALGYEAARLGLNGVAIGSFRDDQVAGLLPIDPDSEIPVLAYACGTTP